MLLIPGPLPPISPSAESVKRWVEERLRDRSAPRLTVEQRHALAGLVVQAILPPLNYRDDPVSSETELEWSPTWRPSPSAELIDCEVAELPWRFEWTATQEGAEIWFDEWDIFSSDKRWIEQGCPKIRSSGGRVVVESFSPILTLLATHARVHYSLGHNEYDEDELEEEPILVLKGLTGWVLYDEDTHRICEQTVGCSDCGETFWLDEYGEHTPNEAPRGTPAMHCPRCFSESLVFFPQGAYLQAELQPEVSARRLVEVLVESGGLIAGDEEALLDAARRALEDTGPVQHRATTLAITMLDSAAVEELYLSDEQLAGVLAAW